jgi:Arc/MetJ-type ribon-helix-helix transcriptional regulator
MTISLPAEQDSFLKSLVANGRFPSREAAVVEAVELLRTEESLNWLHPQPLTAEEAELVYESDPEWEEVENSLCRPRRSRGMKQWDIRHCAFGWV